MCVRPLDASQLLSSFQPSPLLFLVTSLRLRNFVLVPLLRASPFAFCRAWLEKNPPHKHHTGEPILQTLVVPAAEAALAAAGGGGGGGAAQIGGAAAAATARVTAAVSYLRLLSALVTRAPGPAEATARARLLLVALVAAITKEAGVIVDDGAGVTARSAASDSVVLCMSTLRFLLGWAEQSAGATGSSGDPSSSSSSSSSSGSSNRNARRVAQVPSAAPAAAAAAARPTDGAAVEAGHGSETPICLHGLRTRRSTEAAAGGSLSGSSTPCFVCPLVGKTRRCEFVQTIQAVRRG